MKIILNRSLTPVLLALFVVCVFGCLAKPVLLTDAARTGDIGLARDLIDKGAEVDKTGQFGVTALAYAATGEHRDIAKLLLEKGADIDLAMEGCARFKQPYQARCKKVLAELKAGKDQLQPARPASIESPRGDARVVKSDVDELPALKTTPNKNAYAIVIGIENYRQKLPRADFATSDAKLVSEYLIRVMGYPEENIVTLLDDRASYVDLAKYFEKWLPDNVEKDSAVFIYYSGHGAPNPKTGDAYLVPYDGDPSFIDQTGYSLKRMYDALGKLPAKEVIVALDSCFSGAGGRSVIAKGARPLVINLQGRTALSKNMTVLAASAENQISSTYDEKGHGLFTYFLLKGIKNEDVVKSDGSLKVEDLFGYIKPRVERIARKQYGSEQTPQLMGTKWN